ncbi:MAG: hypothetical protein ABIL36_04245 [candidate division WOR-3 bacterium]
MIKPLLTHEIGSLAKPNWRVKAIRGIRLNDDDIEYAKKWGDFLKEDYGELLDILRRRGGFTQEEKEKIIYYSSLFATRLLEKAGLDVVFDGEQHRVEMYEHPVKNIEGFRFYGHVRSFDNKYYRKAAITEKPKLKKFYHLDEYKTISSFAKKDVKIPLTGAYTLVDWSFDEYYLKGVEIGVKGVVERRKRARWEFLKDISENVIKPNIKALIDEGAKFIQIDEPAATTKRNEIDIFVDSVIASVGENKGKAFFGMHICFSDYSLLFPKIKRLEGYINELHFEYANRDTKELGVSWDKRRGYEILKTLRDYNFVIGLGVLDVHTDFIEPAELVRDRVLFALEIIQDPNRIFVAPDCGLRTRTWEVAYEKLCRMVEGVEMVKGKLKVG